MGFQWAVPIIVSVLILGTLGLVTQSYAATINDNVIVGPGETRTLNGDTVNGNVEVNGGNIDFSDVIINGNIIAENCVGESTIEGGTVSGNIILEACNNITVNDNIVTGNVEVDGGDDVVLSANTVDGNITVENATGCNVFLNNVNGNIEIGECSTEAPNTPPTIDSVIFTAEFPTPETVFLTCTANGVSDADGDPVTLSFKWIRFFDGIVLGTESTLTVPHTSVRYTCEVTPFDGIDFGEPVSFTFTPCPRCGGI